MGARKKSAGTCEEERTRTEARAEVREAVEEEKEETEMEMGTVVKEAVRDRVKRERAWMEAVRKGRKEWREDKECRRRSAEKGRRRR